MLCKVRTAEPIGPHHLGKHGKDCRCPGGSSRFRAGTGERERSESAMVSDVTYKLVAGTAGLGKTQRKDYQHGC